MKHYKIMTFGLGGNGADIIDDKPDEHMCATSHSSWYLKPDELQRYICNEHYKPEEIEGCILVNIRDVVEKNYMLAIKAPMCNPKLNDEEIDRFNVSALSDPITSELVKGFAANGGAMAVAAAACGGLDSVSPKALAAWWKAQGATIGIVKNGKVTWENNNNPE
jgi:hypothetical protein